MTGEWIGFTAVIAPAILLGLFFWFRLKARRDMQETIRAALDKGQELSPALIDRLGHPKAPKDKDFRLGVIWCAAGIGFAFLGLAIQDEEAIGAVLGVAAFPIMIGIAYLILNKFAKRED